MLGDRQIMMALNKAYFKMIKDGHEVDSDYMIEFALVIEEQPILHKVIHQVTEAMDSIADRYVHTR